MSTPPDTPDAASSVRSSSPNKTFKSRVGSMMRRTSTGLPFKTGSPGKRSASKSRESLHVNPSDGPSTSSLEHTIPSPVAESARELVDDIQTALTSFSSIPFVPAPANDPIPEPRPESPPGRVFNSELVRSSPEDIPPDLPSAAASRAATPQQFDLTSKAASIASSERRSEPAPAKVEAGGGVATTTAAKAPAAVISMPDSEIVAPPGIIRSPLAKPQAVVTEKKGADYFTVTDEHASGSNASRSSLGTQDVAQQRPLPAGAPSIIVAAAQREPVTPPRPVETEAMVWGAERFTVSPKQSLSSLPGRDSIRDNDRLSQPSHSIRLSTKGSKSSMSTSYGQVVISTTGKYAGATDERRGRSPGPNVRIPNDDPFGDPPVGNAPTDLPSKMKKVALSPIESVDTPLPDAGGRDALLPPPISFPLPPQRNVITSRSVRQERLAYNVGERPGSGDQVQAQSDERSPLLRSAASPQYASSPSNGARLSQLFPMEQALTGSSRVIESLGWQQHSLPDSSFYYAHPELRIVTDLDLRDLLKMQAVTAYVEKTLRKEVMMPFPDWELWLREDESSQVGFQAIKLWVNHRTRLLAFDPPPTITGNSLPDNITDDDRLDMEYRYWAFLEAHPSHAPLMPEARNDALEALTWAYTDCVLPASRNDSPTPPFAPQECQELMTLLRSIDGGEMTPLVQTRIIARVRLRVAEWKQHYYRPNRALPQDATKEMRRPRRRGAFLRLIAEILVSCICLGIPNLLNRSQYRIDEEGGLQSAGSMLVIGACACLVATIILSASVTFVSLYGMDDMAQLAGLLAILFSAASMISTVVALFRYKSEAERPTIHFRGEGIILSRRSVVMSLPLVFLAYAIAAFIAGVALYMLHDTTVTPSRFLPRLPFITYAHWAIPGLWH
ncbi:hypothetical protein WOLCODRAFT_136952 [Wolfiporia cocos MD-104 SS10]|uniref:Uncharacterized protein n=1 Tax=Wolfiporia cocos (strain MD-104) TaxID=742152 RepID=A0A2H3JFN0_WOLCO|nr:hypothetical protein WOLCODRAFT_136952 [Wolfiporia cocos MD-104 SS10]